MLQHAGAYLKFLVLLPIHGPTKNLGFSFFIFTHDKAPKASRLLSELPVGFVALIEQFVLTTELGIS